jgi:hypothetical protein
MIGIVERMSIADAEAIIDRQHHKAMRREILIHRIGVRVIVHVVPAQHHLPRRPAMHEDDGGFAGAPSSRAKSWP